MENDEKMPPLVIIIIIIISIIAAWIFTKVILSLDSTIDDNSTPNGYYTEAIITDKHIAKGNFGKEKHFVKFKIDDDLEIVNSVNIKKYLLLSENETVYLILNARKDYVNNVFTSKEKFDKYIENNGEYRNIVPYNQ